MVIIIPLRERTLAFVKAGNVVLEIDTMSTLDRYRDTTSVL